MKKTILAMLTTAMLCSACQKEAAAPTNEAIAVPKCLEGEFIGLDEDQKYTIIKVTNAKIGGVWTPTHGTWNNNNGQNFNDVGVTFNNVVRLRNGLNFPALYIPSAGYIDRGTKVYFTIDSTKIITQACTSNIVFQSFRYRPAPSVGFCINSFSLTKCK